MQQVPPTVINNNRILNDLNRIGFTIEQLDQQKFSVNYHDSPDTSYVTCDYILPDKLCDESWCDFSVINFNIRSMKSNFNNFTTEIVTSNTKFDVIGLCETRMTKSSEKLYSLNGFKLHTNNVSSRKGGVCLYAREEYHSKLIPDLCVTSLELESIFIDVTIGTYNNILI